MHREPGAGNLLARREPHVGILVSIFDESSHRAHPACPAYDPGMQSNGHHSWDACRFRVKYVEGFPHVLVEIAALDEARAVPKTEVVDIRRVGHDKVTLAPDLHKIWRVIVIGVAIIEETTLLHHQTARPHARSIPAIPADRPLTACLFKGFYREADVFPLFFLA